MARTFDDIVEEVIEHAVKHEKQTPKVPPFKLTKEDAIIAFSAFEEAMKVRNSEVGDTIMAMAIKEAMNKDNYVYLAKLMHEEMLLVGVPLAPGWGKREAISGDSENAVRYQVDSIGSNPDDCMILQSAGRYVTTAMDYR